MMKLLIWLKLISIKFWINNICAKRVNSCVMIKLSKNKKKTLLLERFKTFKFGSAVSIGRILLILLFIKNSVFNAGIIGKFSRTVISLSVRSRVSNSF